MREGGRRKGVQWGVEVNGYICVCDACVRVCVCAIIERGRKLYFR